MKNLRHIILQEIRDIRQLETGPSQEDRYESVALPNAQYDRDWIDKITTYDYGMRLTGDVETPGFALRLPDGELTQDPIYFPTKPQISQDSRFCRTHKTGIFSLGSERPGMYRGSTEVNDAYLHLEFDSDGLMILKPVGRTQPGIDHFGGSHWDKYNILNLDSSRGGGCNYSTWKKFTGDHAGDLRFSDTELTRGQKLNDRFDYYRDEIWSDEEWYYYSLQFILKEIEELRNYSWILKNVVQNRDETIHPQAQKFISRDVRGYQAMSRVTSSRTGKKGATDSERNARHNRIVGNLKIEIEKTGRNIATLLGKRPVSIDDLG